LDFVKKSYILGRLRSTLKGSEYKHLNYEAVDEQSESASFTTLEEYALQHVKLHAADGIKGLAADLAAGAFDRLKASTQATVNEASIRGIIRDRIAIAIIEKENSQKVASSLAKELKSGWSRDWRRVAETELHRAKMMGAAQAIVNKIGIYKNSDGADSLVSVVPSPTRCEDCGHHFLDDRGNPRVFRLSQLLKQGTNAESGVKHTRSGGLHNHWKTTLPPLHPRCGCRIVYVPKGMGWETGKLRVIDENIYVEELKKAVDTGSMSATIKPPGPKSSQGQSASAELAASPPSMAGAPAPGNTPGPGAPPSSGSTAGTAAVKLGAGGQQDMVDCPFSGGQECLSNGGNGAKHHKSDGKIMEAHRKALEGGVVPSNPEAAAADREREQQLAVSWGKLPHTHDKVMSHLSKGDLSEVRNTKEGMSREDIEEARNNGLTGITDSYKVRIKDNGNAMMKPSPPLSMSGGDLGNCPAQRHHHHEAAAYSYSNLLGLDSHVPPTATRDYEGTGQSMQQWLEDYRPLSATLRKSGMSEKHGGNNYSALMKACPKDKREALRKKVDEIICMDLASNNGDSHGDQWMVSKDFSDVRKIDNGVAFGNFVGTLCLLVRCREA
jgi:hypothetical protein